MNAIMAYMKVSSTIKVGRMPVTSPANCLPASLNSPMKCSPAQVTALRIGLSLPPDEVGIEVLAFIQSDAVACGNADFQSAERLGIGDAIDAGKLEDQDIAVEPGGLHLTALP